MCGVVGVLAHTHANQDIYDALTVLQHRGQSAAGMMTCDGGRVYLCKANGLVKDVVHQADLLRLQGEVGIGHVRYPTAGSHRAEEAQPLYVNFPYGLSIAHNGNLVNTARLREEVKRVDLRHLNTFSDSEVLLNVFAHELHAFSPSLAPKHIFQAVDKLNNRCVGGYAVIILIAGRGLLAFRDPHGIRPLIYGVKAHPQGPEYMIASESVALSSLGYHVIDDIAPGGAIFIDHRRKLHQHLPKESQAHAPCLFEYVYFARPDSILDQVSVYQFRRALGAALAKKVIQYVSKDNIDVVMPIPETSCSVALMLAKTLGLPYREGFVKNRYIGRTFIMPEQDIRRRSVRRKLNTIASEFTGKRVLLVDDSIVRGTTAGQIVQMAKEAGAKKVYFASAAPCVRYPNVYGIDIPAASELIAHGNSIAKIAEKIGADGVIFQDLSALYESMQAQNPHITHFEDSVFTGRYITSQVTADYLDALAKARG